MVNLDTLDSPAPTSEIHDRTRTVVPSKRSPSGGALIAHDAEVVQAEEQEVILKEVKRNHDPIATGQPRPSFASPPASFLALSPLAPHGPRSPGFMMRRSHSPASEQGWVSRPFPHRCSYCSRFLGNVKRSQVEAIFQYRIEW